MPSNVVFYVYVYRDPRPGKNLEPIYIGKGRGYRYRQHWNRTEDHRNPLLCRVLNKIRAVSLKPKIKIVRRFVLEADAFAYEIKLIAKYGRRDLGLGPLCNLTDGGDGPSGSLAVIARMRMLHTDPDFAEARDKRGRQHFLNLFADPDFTKAHAERMSEKAHKFNADPEVKRLASERMRALNAEPANAERTRQRMADPEAKRKCAERFRKLNADPTFAKAHSKRCSENIRKRNADPAFQAKCKAGKAAARARRAQHN